MKCPFSGKKRHISDFEVALLRAKCPVCSAKVKITIPDRVMYENVARFPIHQEGVNKI